MTELERYRKALTAIAAAPLEENPKLILMLCVSVAQKALTNGLKDGDDECHTGAPATDGSREED